jgi:hypothetical protein
MVYIPKQSVKPSRADDDRLVGKRALGRGALVLREGKVSLKAEFAGLVRIDVEKLDRISSIGEITVATQRDRSAVTQGGNCWRALR